MLKIVNTLSVILGWCVVCGLALPLYQQGADKNYLEVLSALQNAKGQGNYPGNVQYEQVYDGYEYGPSEQTYQDYINELMKEQMLSQQMPQGGYDDQGGEDLGPQMALEVGNDWPLEDLQVGQVVGVAVDTDNNPLIFHRGSRAWDASHKLFDEENNFIAKDDGPIKEHTLLKLNSVDGSVLSKWGENRFYLPHGLNIDQQGNTWVTDIGLHQVFKFEQGKEEPSLTLGEAFKAAENDDDHNRFCKPTDVAVSSSGDIFVADGYCNSRVMKFDKMGSFVGQFGEGQFIIPHSLALAEDLDTICVADREDMRIVCYNAGLNDPETFGKPELEFDDPGMRRIYSIDYSLANGLLYAVTGPGENEKAIGFTINLRKDTYENDLIDEWSPDNEGFGQPHAIAASQDGNTVYVGEISPNRIWKFNNAATLEEAIDDIDASEEEGNLKLPESDAAANELSVPNEDGVDVKLENELEEEEKELSQHQENVDEQEQQPKEEDEVKYNSDEKNDEEMTKEQEKHNEQLKDTDKKKKSSNM